MAREEEIIKQVEIYTSDASNLIEWSDGWEDYNDYEYVKKAFIKGAKWADEHPKEANGKELLYICQRTGEIIKKEMIMKACEWISQSYTSGVLDWKNCDSIIEDFKKAMEE